MTSVYAWYAKKYALKAQGNKIDVDINPINLATAAWLALLTSVGRAPDCCAGGLGFETQTGPTLRVLK